MQPLAPVFDMNLDSAEHATSRHTSTIKTTATKTISRSMLTRVVRASTLPQLSSQWHIGAPFAKPTLRVREGICMES